MSEVLTCHGPGPGPEWSSCMKLCQTQTHFNICSMYTYSCTNTWNHFSSIAADAEGRTLEKMDVIVRTIPIDIPSPVVSRKSCPDEATHVLTACAIIGKDITPSHHLCNSSSICLLCKGIFPMESTQGGLSCTVEDSSVPGLT